MKKVFVPGLVSGVAMLVVWFLLNPIFNVVFPSLKGEYINSDLFRPWSDPLMLLIFIHPIILGFLLAWTWNKVKPVVGGFGINKGLRFGFSYWVITSIPGMFISYSTFPVSFSMILSWTISGLIQALVAGAIFTRLNK